MIFTGICQWPICLPQVRPGIFKYVSCISSGIYLYILVSYSEPSLYVFKYVSVVLAYTSCMSWHTAFISWHTADVCSCMFWHTALYVPVYILYLLALSPIILICSLYSLVIPVCSKYMRYLLAPGPNLLAYYFNIFLLIG